MAFGKLGARGGFGSLGALGRASGGAPTISGTAQVGQTLTSSAVSTWNVGGSARSFLSNSTTYVPVPGDVGKTVTATSASGTSAPTSAVIDAALPAVSPPLTYGALVSILMNSIGQQNAQGVSRSGDATQGGVNSRATGELTQLLSIKPHFNGINWYDQSKTTGGTNRLSNGSDNGINGQTSTQIAARVSDIVSLHAVSGGVCVINMGTNNTQQKATILSDLASTVSTLRAASILAIVMTIRPNTLANESVSRAKADIQSINTGIVSYVAGLADSGVVLCDINKQYDRGDGYMDPLDTYDRLLHPNECGAELGAWGNNPTTPSPYSVAGALRKLIGDGDLYGDILTANANALTNPTMTGSGGAVSGGTVNGFAPTNWRWENQSTVLSNVACSVITNPFYSGQSAVATITPSGTANFERANFRPSAFNVTIASLPGKWVRAFFEIETDGAPWMMACAAIVSEVDTGVVFQASQGFVPTTVPGGGNFFSGLRPIARRRYLMSEPVLMGASATQVQPSLQLVWAPNGANQIGLGGVATSAVKVHRAAVFTVPNPKTAWNS